MSRTNILSVPRLVVPLLSTKYLEILESGLFFLR
jgi:hypothetical protein